MKILFAILGYVSLLMACTKPPVTRTYLPTPVTPATPTADTMNEPTVNDTNTVKLSYLALGDSYTIGQSVEVADRFPNQTSRILTQYALSVDTTEIIAHTGWTTGNLLSQLSFTPPAKDNYDIVSLLIGVNNQYQGGSQADYRKDFVILLNKAIAWAGNRRKRVFVLSIPDYSVTPLAAGSDRDKIAREINEFNTINLEESKAAGVNYLNITNSTRQASLDPSLIASDGLHPSGKEYYKWAEMLAPMIKTTF